MCIRDRDLDAAAASLKANQANVDAWKATVEQARLTTRTQIASTQAKVEAQQAALNSAELNLQYGTIEMCIRDSVPKDHPVKSGSQKPASRERRGCRAGAGTYRRLEAERYAAIQARLAPS